MGFVIQRLWGGYLENFFQTDLTPSRRITRGFLHQTHPPQLRYWAAKIALRLLMCRTAEIRHKIQSKLEIPWGLSLRRGSHWSFATQWCTLLIQAPPVNELLLMLWQLTENTFYCLPEEIERKKLVKWLKKFGEVADPLVNIFEVGDRWKPMWYERHDLWVYAEQKEWSAIGFADKPRRRLQGVDALLTLR
ncbi:hypothetical protein B0H13DRAFT_2154167 [Mycena leptocephala]|nr:hypothetical protein B0H13DRAFT_2154167 [Mycena leptocephala]